MTQFNVSDDGGTKDLVSKRDIILESDSDQDGAGDIIFRTGGVERARINYAGTGTGWGNVLGGFIPDVTAAAPTGVAATDTAVLQAAINATPAGGSLALASGTYVINAALTIPDHITIIGHSHVANFTSIASGGTPNGPASPYLRGTVISQLTAATDIIQITAAAKQINLRDLGLTFDSAIRNTNTGHGINYSPVAHGSGSDIGLSESLWSNITVYGHDGNHYGIKLVNPLLCTFVHWQSYGGGGLYLGCDSYDTNMGNFVSIHSYVDLFNSGTADGYHLDSRLGRGATGNLNLCTFIRPQCNITGAAATAGTQYLWRSNGGANLPTRIEIISPDFETSGSNPLDTGGPASGTILRKGGLLNATPNGGADQDIGYQSFTGAGTYTFTVPDGVTRVRVRAVGAGGQGGGGGSNSGAAANVGGGGGAAGNVTEAWLTVVPYAAYTITVGAGGSAAGGGGASGGNAGTAGSNGAQSSFGGDVKAGGGAGGAGGGASSTASVGGGVFARSGGTTVTQFVPGCGGVAANPNGVDAIPMPPGVCGGGGGGAASAAKGGNGGNASTNGFPQYTAVGGGAGAGAAGAAGGNGTTATTPGCGGGGGGGALTGGAGGNGGNGADGMVEVFW